MENQEKKEYVTPQMIVEEYDCHSSLLACSGEDMTTCIDPDD